MVVWRSFKVGALPGLEAVITFSGGSKSYSQHHKWLISKSCARIRVLEDQESYLGEKKGSKIENTF